MEESRKVNLRGKPFYLSEEQAAWVTDTLAGMSNEEKAGQLFCILGDAYAPEDLERLVGEYGIGGVLFRPNPSEQVGQRYARASALAKIPLLKAANLEEGGAGVITDGTYFGSQMQVAAADDPEMARKFALVCAAEGRSVGVNWTFSPVVDIDLNFRNPITNVRTFGSDAERVLKNASAYVEEIQKNGVAAACKHFPGDGVDFRDQHLHPTYNDLSAEAWYASYGKIYQSLIDQGLYSVMVGHIVQPNLILEMNPEATDADFLPASLSRELLTGVLRGKLGFQGVIITDATIMGGYTMAMERRRGIPASIAAGCDMICFSTDIYEDLGYIRDGLENGLLTQERLDEAVTRILALKAKLNECAAGEYEADHLSREECRAWSVECGDRAVTLVKDTQQLIPVSREAYPQIRLVTVGEDAMTDGSLKETAAQVLAENGFEVELYDPFADDLHGTKELPANRLTLILANYPAASNQVTVRPSWCPKHALEIPRFVHEEKSAFLSFANPYHLQDVPRVRTYINAYTATAANVRLALEKLIGKSEFKGNSPVDAFCGLRDTKY